MSRKLNHKKNLDHTKEIKKTADEEYYSISEKYLQEKGKFSFSNIRDKSDKLQAYEELHKKYKYITGTKWKDILATRKSNGLENIELNKLTDNCEETIKNQAKDLINGTSSTDITVFRFDHDKRRLLCIKHAKRPMLYIVAVETDLGTAYKH